MTIEKTTSRAKPARKKVYERRKETDIPDYITELFAKDGYELRWVRWLVDGKEDFKNLSNRDGDGYEFVKADELPAEYLGSIRLVDTKHRQGLVTHNDLCLMKVDSELRQSRREYFDQVTNDQVNTADMNVLFKKSGFKDLGTKSKTTMKEPVFKE